MVLTEGQPPQEIAITLTAEHTDAAAVLEIRLEDGNSLRLPIQFAGAAAAAERQVDAQRLVRKTIRLPDALPLGYHELTFELAGERSPAARLIVCPSRAYHPEWLEAGQRRGAGHQFVWAAFGT